MPLGELLEARILKSNYSVSVGMGMIDNDIEELCYLLRENPKIRMLNIGSTDFSDKSIQKLIELLPNSQITGLDLSSTQITDNGAIEILKHWPLEFIDLSNNGSSITQATGYVLVQHSHLLNYEVSATTLSRDFCFIARIDKIIKTNNERIRKSSPEENKLAMLEEEIKKYKDLLTYLFFFKEEEINTKINYCIIKLLLFYLPSPAYLMAISRVSRKGKTIASGITLWNYYGFASRSEYINTRQTECVKQLEQTKLIRDFPSKTERKTLFLDFYEPKHDLKMFRFHFHCYQQIFIRRLCNEHGYSYSPYNRLGITWMNFNVDEYQVKFHMMNSERWHQIPEKKKANIVLSFPSTLEEIIESEYKIRSRLRYRDDNLTPKLTLHLIDDRLAQQIKEINDQEMMNSTLCVSKVHALDVVKAIIRKYEQWSSSLPREEEIDNISLIDLNFPPKEVKKSSCFK